MAVGLARFAGDVRGGAVSGVEEGDAGPGKGVFLIPVVDKGV